MKRTKSFLSLICRRSSYRSATYGEWVRTVPSMLTEAHWFNLRKIICTVQFWTFWTLSFVFGSLCYYSITQQVEFFDRILIKLKDLQKSSAPSHGKCKASPANNRQRLPTRDKSQINNYRPELQNSNNFPS